MSDPECLSPQYLDTCCAEMSLRPSASPLDTDPPLTDTGIMHRVRVSLIVAGTVTAAVASLGLSGCRPIDSASASGGQASASPVGSATVRSTGKPSATRPPTARSSTTKSSTAKPSATNPSTARPSPAPSPSSATPTIPAKLKIGSSGSAVVLLQQKLLTLGYWLSSASGTFGATTQQAVYALQKAAGQNPSGVVTAKTWKALDNGIRPTARSKSGTVIEVDLKRDLILFVTDGQVKYILNTSTGGGYVFYENGRREIATTPKGHFTTYRVIDGPHRSPLGLLYRPRYFFEGVAIHGDSSVPSHPVSHGCVRVTDAAINWIWSTHLDPIGRKVWTY
jgi:peptidoglycan hydrolase-like protein with peptidoglycan-binding domain